MKERMSEFCPKECEFDASDATERRLACDECYNSPSLPDSKRWINVGENIKLFFGLGGKDKVYVNGKKIKRK